MQLVQWCSCYESYHPIRGSCNKPLAPSKNDLWRLIDTLQQTTRSIERYLYDHLKDAQEETYRTWLNYLNGYKLALSVLEETIVVMENERGHALTNFERPSPKK